MEQLRAKIYADLMDLQSAVVNLKKARQGQPGLLHTRAVVHARTAHTHVHKRTGHIARSLVSRQSPW